MALVPSKVTSEQSYTAAYSEAMHASPVPSHIRFKWFGFRMKLNLRLGRSTGKPPLGEEETMMMYMWRDRKRTMDECLFAICPFIHPLPDVVWLAA